MARIRTIKPEFWGSPDTATAHPVTRLTYIAMWNWADDYGRGTANFKELEGFVFPNDEVDELSDGKFRKFRDIVAEVQRAYKVTFYECDGRLYYEIPSWSEHQRTERKAKARIPDPSDGVIVDLTTGNTALRGTSDIQRRNFRDTTAEAPQSPLTGKGKGTGEETNTVHAAEAAPSAKPKRARGEYEPDFEDWWSTYPKTAGKRQASEAYRSAKRAFPDVDLKAELARWLSTYAKEKRSKGESVDVQYLPNGATWLNKERWTDYPLPTMLPTKAGQEIPEWTRAECDDILGGSDYWVPTSPPEGLDLFEEKAWKREQMANHLNERRRKAWEVTQRERSAA